MFADYQPAADLLRDRVILVTGAGDGIGACAARSLAAHGATIVLLGRSLKKLERVYDGIEQAGHPQPAIFPLNLLTAGTDDYAKLADAVAQAFGRLDGLLHNAARLGTLAPLDHYRPEAWDEVLRVNLTAPFLMTRALIPLLLDAPDPSVLFTSDAVGRRGRAYWGAYAVAKAGLENLMEVTADELEGRVRVNSLDPGPVRTMMRVRAYPGEKPSQLVPPEAIMTPYLYLLGPDSHHVHGQKLSAQDNHVPEAPDAGE